MGFRHIHRDVKIAALNLYEGGLLSLPQILDALGFSERTFYRILYLWRTTGDVVKGKSTTRGRPRLLHHDDLEYLLELVRHDPDWFLDELLHLLSTNRFISVHYTTIHRELERAGMSVKKLAVIAAERSDPSRNNYTSKNDKTPVQRRGLDGIVASTVVEGSMHREQYLEFLEHQVVRKSVCPLV
ncbi:hypothetical protein B0H17DRAFT_1157081 [Mycena rosella]|uniref:Transposase n=1 Tax=Mycena rosella TaxID=1033263 RepID=A0AAD7M6U4_MYCRO|nr:hypothetical protein B0H17DRAFT_1157081 [Mycena rosella]